MDLNNEDLEKKKLFWNKFHTITNIILIIWLLVIAIYIAIKVGPEIENFKTLNKDVCRLCEQKTGGVCMKSEQIINTNNFNLSLPN